MKSIIFITLYAILCVNKPQNMPNTIVGRHQLTLEEAERILGESAIQKERKSDNQTEYYVSKTTFTAKEIDTKTQKQSNLYYMVERFKDEETATKTIQSYIKGNQTHQGFELLTGYGDEAFFQTDKDNFCLLIIRKSNKMIRIKVNKLTVKTSFEELRKIGKEVIERV
jgi:hypothetical protein